MFKKLLLTVATLSVAATAFCEAACYFTDQINPVSVDFAKLAKNTLNIIYGVESIFRSNVDHAYINYKRTGDNTYNSTMVIVRKDGVTKNIDYTTEDRHNGILVDTHMIEDGKSQSRSETKLVVNSYILGKTDEDAILFYSCNERDPVTDEDDLRFIIAPDDSTGSETSAKELLELDKKFNFKGNLFKLHRKL